MKNKQTIGETKGLWGKKERGTFGWVSDCLKEWDCDGTDEPRKKTAFTAERLKGDSTFAEMFGKVGVFFTKEQVAEVVENHEELLTREWCNLFPYENKKGERFVLRVYWDASKWYLDVRRLEDGYVWDAERGHVIFLPQQATLTPEPSGALALGHLDSLPELDDRVHGAIKLLKENGFKITKCLTREIEF